MNFFSQSSKFIEFPLIRVQILRIILQSSIDFSNRARYLRSSSSLWLLLEESVIKLSQPLHLTHRLEMLLILMLEVLPVINLRHFTIIKFQFFFNHLTHSQYPRQSSVKIVKRYYTILISIHNHESIMKIQVSGFKGLCNLLGHLLFPGFI